MKFYDWTPLTLVIAALAVAGCNKPDNQPKVDTAPLENSFKTADPATQNNAQRAIADIKSADYSGALTQLKQMAGNARLTPEQQQAIKNTLSQIEQGFKDTANKVKESANTALNDASKSIEKAKDSLSK